MNDMTLNQRIVVWARSKLGQRVGRRGECWDLAELALRHVGAKTSNDLGEVGPDTDYVWGTAKEVSRIQPGDILQFRNHEVVTVTKVRIEWRDGSWEAEERTRTASRGHHTAIVNGSPDQNGRVATLDQHVRPRGRVVQNKRLHTQSIPTTTTTTHEDRRNPHTGKVAPATITTQVTVTVSGRIWAYAPIPKPDSDE